MPILRGTGEQRQYWGTGNIRKHIFEIESWGTGEQIILFSGEQGNRYCPLYSGLHMPDKPFPIDVALQMFSKEHLHLHPYMRAHTHTTHEHTHTRIHTTTTVK